MANACLAPQNDCELCCSRTIYHRIVKTGSPREPAWLTLGHRILAGGSFFLAVLALEELDVHVGSVHPHQLAAPIGQSGRREQQEELLEIEALDRALDRQCRVIVGNRPELAIAPPCAVDGHDADIVTAAEGDAFCALAFIG